MGPAPWMEHLGHRRATRKQGSLALDSEPKTPVIRSDSDLGRRLKQTVAEVGYRMSRGWSTALPWLATDAIFVMKKALPVPVL